MSTQSVTRRFYIYLVILATVLILGRIWIPKSSGSNFLIVHFYDERKPELTNQLAMLYAIPQIPDLEPLNCTFENLETGLAIQAKKEVETQLAEIHATGRVNEETPIIPIREEKPRISENKPIEISFTPTSTEDYVVNPEYLKCMDTFESTTICNYLPVFK